MITRIASDRTTFHNYSSYTLIIRGEKDKITPKAIMDELHQGIKNSVYVEIPNTGHLPNLEDPLAFNRELNEFLLEM